MLIDPMLVEFRIKGMSREVLQALTMRCYHPIAMIETMTPARIKEASDYWKQRKKSTDIFGKEREYSIEPISFDDLYGLNILSREEFERKVRDMQRELKGITSAEYHDFIRGRNSQETFERAYVLSFLITEGFVSLRVDRLNDRIEMTRAGKRGEKSSSVAIPLWEK
jgi:hypothetical protein